MKSSSRSFVQTFGVDLFQYRLQTVTGSSFKRRRELIALRALVEYVQQLLPLDWFDDLLGQELVDLVGVSVDSAVYVVVNADQRQRQVDLLQSCFKRFHRRPHQARVKCSRHGQPLHPAQLVLLRILLEEVQRLEAAGDDFAVGEEVIGDRTFGILDAALKAPVFGLRASRSEVGVWSVNHCGHSRRILITCSLHRFGSNLNEPNALVERYRAGEYQSCDLAQTEARGGHAVVDRMRSLFSDLLQRCEGCDCDGGLRVHRLIEFLLWSVVAQL